MPLTPNSGLVPYCTPAQYIAREDVRQTGDLVRDDGTQATPSELLTDPNLFVALQDASGEVEAACFVGNRYTAADLQALAAQGGNSGAFLARIVSGLAYGLVHDRRGMVVTVNPQSVPNARAQLDSLRSGAAIFAFAESEAAGLAYSRFRTRLELDNAGLLTRSSAGRRFLGRSWPGPGRWGGGH